MDGPLSPMAAAASGIKSAGPDPQGHGEFLEDRFWLCAMRNTARGETGRGVVGVDARNNSQRARSYIRRPLTGSRPNQPRPLKVLVAPGVR